MINGSQENIHFNCPEGIFLAFLRTKVGIRTEIAPCWWRLKSCLRRKESKRETIIVYYIIFVLLISQIFLLYQFLFLLVINFFFQRRNFHLFFSSSFFYTIRKKNKTKRKKKWGSNQNRVTTCFLVFFFFREKLRKMGGWRNERSSLSGFLSVSVCVFWDRQNDSRSFRLRDALKKLFNLLCFTRRSFICNLYLDSIGSFLMFFSDEELEGTKKRSGEVDIQFFFFFCCNFIYFHT